MGSHLSKHDIVDSTKYEQMIWRQTGSQQIVTESTKVHTEWNKMEKWEKGNKGSQQREQQSTTPDTH